MLGAKQTRRGTEGPRGSRHRGRQGMPVAGLE